MKMDVSTQSIHLSTKGHNDIIDITGHVADTLKESKLNNGILTVFIPGSTAAITTIEYEPGLLRDLPKALEKIAPTSIRYHHDATWGDGNVPCQVVNDGTFFYCTLFEREFDFGYMAADYSGGF